MYILHNKNFESLKFRLIMTLQLFTLILDANYGNTWPLVTRYIKYESK